MLIDRLLGNQITQQNTLCFPMVTRSFLINIVYRVDKNCATKQTNEYFKAMPRHTETSFLLQCCLHDDRAPPHLLEYLVGTQELMLQNTTPSDRPSEQFAGIANVGLPRKKPTWCQGDWLWALRLGHQSQTSNQLTIHSQNTFPPYNRLRKIQPSSVRVH